MADVTCARCRKTREGLPRAPLPGELGDGPFAVVLPGAAGDASTSVDLGGGVAAGDLLRYQFWYRDPVGGPCGSDFNLSNGVEVSWVP